MRILQSVARQSSEQSTAHFSSRPTVWQLKGVFDTILNWFENHRPQRTRMASRFTTIASFPSVFLQLLQCLRQHPSFSAHWAALMTKTDLNYPAFSLRFVDFAVQFWFHCKVYSTRSDARDKFGSGVIFLDQSQSFASHSNQWDCFIL